MPCFICTICGNQFADSGQPRADCPVCLDERQYLKPTGQGWTTHDQLRLTHRNSLRAKEPGLMVTTVVTGEEARETLEFNPVDLLVTDKNLPGLGRMELDLVVVNGDIV